MKDKTSSTTLSRFTGLKKAFFGEIKYQGETIFTKAYVVQLLDVDEHTVERYLSSHEDELTGSGYRLLQGKLLKYLKVSPGSYIDISTEITIPVIFYFRTVLNLVILLT